MKFILEAYWVPKLLQFLLTWFAILTLVLIHGQQTLMWIACRYYLRPTTGVHGISPGEQPRGLDRISNYSSCGPRKLGNGYISYTWSFPSISPVLPVF